MSQFSVVPSGCALAMVAVFAPSLGIAQESADELAKKLSNPMQYNVDFDIGTANGTKHYLNVQPVIPHSLNDHLNLITRAIVPVIYQDDLFGDSGDQFGLGDITRSSSRRRNGLDNLLAQGRPFSRCSRPLGVGPTGRSSITSGRLPATTTQ